jgi:2-polyprenyl-3-methyl-5-hydroxy-6-metoxy-1,4-benzoquinol methylase
MLKLSDKYFFIKIETVFEKYIQSDIRKNRPTATVTEESLTNRFEVMLPAWLVKNKRILDLGSATGVAGHWCLHHGATHYTGVEIQQSFSSVSIELLSSTYRNNQFQIINDDLINFVNSNSTQWDIVIAAGVIHGFFNPFDTIKQITQLSNQYIVVETLNTPEPNNVPTIHFDRMNMVRYAENNLPYQGITPSVGIRAFELIMNEHGFVQDGEQLFPKRIKDSHDAYNDSMNWSKLDSSTQRFLARYKKSIAPSQSLETKIRNNISVINNLQPADHDKIKIEKNNQIWKFDDSVAQRFHQEAMSNIPDYQRVISLCLTLALEKFTKQSCIVDVGSAIGYTMHQFIEQGFVNVVGVESSESMIKYSQHKEQVILSTTFPNITADLILANWTLHFIIERKQYILNMFGALTSGGVVIITDKTAQSDTIKKLYYDFKRKNGVDNNYIKDKEEKLKGYMHCYTCEWYLDTLASVGFKNIQIINSSLGFVTFYAEK